ncbi:MAG: aspartate kinase [Firmicutes bacterium]|nr:aspartate kinase [Bacillota bacterium]
MQVLVQKYGGSSVADTQKIKAVARRIISAKNSGYHVVAVVSAQGDTTDELVAKAREISSSPSKREMDMLLSTGEQISIALLAMAIAEEGYPVISLTGPQGGICTDALHTRAKILRVDPVRVRKELSDGRIVIVAGFQGINDMGDITTLGRGGSDTTAVALAAALDAKACEIYTDVDGVYTADPRLVSSARKLDEISHGEMLELASLGAAILQPRAVELAAAWGVTIHVRSSFSDSLGTMVIGGDLMEKQRVVSGVTRDLNVVKVMLVDVPDRPGVAHSIFSTLAQKGINVDMIVQTTKQGPVTDLLFSIGQDDYPATKRLIEELAKDLGITQVLFSERLAKVSIVGAGMMSNPGVAATMFGILAEHGINIEVISTSEIKVSCLIEASKVDEAVKAIHDGFRLGEEITA